MRVVQPVAVRKDTIALAFRTGGRLCGRFEIVLPVRDRRDQLLQYHFVVFNQPFRQIFEQRNLVRVIKQRKIRLHPQRGVFAFNHLQP